MFYFFRLLRGLYWKANRRFLEKFAETIIGEGQRPELKPNGKEIIDKVMAFLAIVPDNAYVQTTFALILLPLAVPERLPRSDVLRFLMKIWMVFRGHFMRPIFSSSSKKKRTQMVDTMFKRLNRQLPEELDDLIKMCVVLNTIKLTISGCYMELDRVWDGINYSPFPKPRRPWDPPSGSKIRKTPPTPVAEFLHESVVKAKSVRRNEPNRNNYCVIGSGAGGAIAALYIQRYDPDARIVMLEEGPLVTNEAFPTSLLDASAALYMNTGLTLSKDMMSTFQQGRCVGGSTTLNNSVAFKPEGFWWKQNIVERWRLLGAELDFDELYAGFDDIMELIHAHPIEDRIITDAAFTLAEGFERIGHKPKIVTVNSVDCIGCGRCNAGCQYDAKQSMMISTIPEFIKNGGYLVPNAKVEELNIKETEDGWTIKDVTITEDGEHVTVEADRFVLAAGAYASTKLLWKSGFMGVEPGMRTVGKRFTGNMGTPLVAVFPEKVRGWAGQQVGFVIELPDVRCVIETAFGPPALLGLDAPQWGNSFMRVVESFEHMAIVAPVIAGIDYGQISRGYLPTAGWVLDYRLGGFTIDYAMGPEDWLRMAKAMKISAHAMFAMGADAVFDTRFSGKILWKDGDINKYFDGIGPADYIKVQTAHMQGGNVIHKDPRLGVVDGNLKVHGFDNTWICDGSVVPAAITLNLQLTIMALAKYAAARIASDGVGA